MLRFLGYLRLGVSAATTAPCEPECGAGLLRADEAFHCRQQEQGDALRGDITGGIDDVLTGDIQGGTPMAIHQEPGLLIHISLPVFRPPHSRAHPSALHSV